MIETYYDFDSGDLSLDFANTNDWHARSDPVETMVNFADLIRWGEQAGLLSAAQIDQLRHLESNAPAQVRRAYEKAIQLREAIYQIFSNRYAGAPVPEEGLRLLNTFAREAMAHLELAPSSTGFTWKWLPGTAEVDLILWSVAHAAAELLTSDRVDRARECDDDHGCGYLFIDQTRKSQPALVLDGIVRQPC